MGSLQGSVTSGTGMVRAAVQIPGSALALISVRGHSSVNSGGFKSIIVTVNEHGSDGFPAASVAI